MKQYKIHDDFKSVIDYIEQDTPSAELDRLVNDFV